jgi:hypothetical protein
LLEVLLQVVVALAETDFKQYLNYCTFTAVLAVLAVAAQLLLEQVVGLGVQAVMVVAAVVGVVA